MRTFLHWGLFSSVLIFHSLAHSLVSAGYGHSCASRGDALYCWGWNFYGQLGVTTPTETSGVVKVGEYEGLKQIALGGSHACIEYSAGVACWGKNRFGFVGDGTRENVLQPKLIIPARAGQTIGKLSAHDTNTCAVIDGGLACWGWDYSCHLGHPECVGRDETKMSLVPQFVPAFPPGSGVTDVDVGPYHVCAVVKGGVQCWGYAIYGMLGNGETDAVFFGSPSPVRYLGENSGATRVAVGNRYSCAIAKHKVYCWGNNRFIGSNDNSYASETTTPTLITNNDNKKAIQLEASGNTTCAWFKNEQLRCWGFGSAGQLGDGTLASSLVPVAVKLPNDFVVSALAAGYTHFCAQNPAATTLCWGSNGFKQILFSSTANFPRPVVVTFDRHGY